MLDGTRVFELNNDIVVRGIGDKCWAFDTNSGKQYRLNELSYDILSMLDGQKNIDMITNCQKKHYNIDRETLFSDVLSFLEKAEKTNIVKEVTINERI